MNKYAKYIRPYNKTQSIRLDLEIYQYLEIIRCLHANDFVSPSTADIFRTLLRDYVHSLKEDKRYEKDIMIIEMAIASKLKEAGHDPKELEQVGLPIENN